MLTALFLSLFSFLAPSVMLHDRVALLTVLPSTALTNPQARAGDGPSLFLGALGSFTIYSVPISGYSYGFAGSCSRRNNAGHVSCTVTSIAPQYGMLAFPIQSSSCSNPHYLIDTSALPGTTSNNILSAPPSTAPAFIAVAISFSFVFFFAYSIVSFRHKFGEGMSEKLDKPMVQRLTAWVGVFGFMIGTYADSHVQSVLNDELSPFRPHVFPHCPHVVRKGHR